MTSDHPTASNRFPLFIDPTHPDLLDGLENWLALGLLEEEQVKALARKYLSCSVPVLASHDFAIEVVETERRQPHFREIPIVSTVSSFWQSFRAELTVRWLLFLGIFLVVLSSAVLAGTQWQNISNLAQYSILWLYTLAFWGVGTALQRRENLKLTSQTLQTITLLLIPVNFWAMDTFLAWSSGIDLLTIIIASVSLLGIVYRQSRSNLSIVSALTFLGLSVTHWGWSIEGFPLIAIYSGLTLTGLLLLTRREAISNNVLEKVLIFYSIAILLTRGLFVAQLPLQDLGLAIALLGWLLPYSLSLNTTPIFRSILETVTIILLIFGWLISVSANLPLPSTIISILALQFFWKRLRQNWWQGDVIALFFIGFQLLFRLRDLLPFTVREMVVNSWMQWTRDASYSPEIYGITLFPYVFLWIFFAQWLYHQERVKLSQLVEFLSLILGTVLTLISLFNDTARSINLVLSTATLLYALNTRSIRRILLYFTHAIGLFTLLSIVNTIYPTLSISQWAIAFLILMSIEWIVSSLNLPQMSTIVAQSCWDWGIILASIAYSLLAFNLTRTFAFTTPNFWSLSWFITPILLTYIATKNREFFRHNALTLSNISLVIAQVLTLWQFETRIIGLGIAVVVMFINTFYDRQRYTARLHIGFILATLFVSIWHYGFNSKSLFSLFLDNNWILVPAVILSVLWIIGLGLSSRQNPLLFLYTSSIREWGIGLCLWNLGRLTIHLTMVVGNLFTPHWQIPTACVLIGTTLLYYSRKQLDNFTVWVVVWLGEILVVETVLGMRRDFILVAGINLLVGWIVLGITRPLLSRFPSLSAIKLSPLVFALMALGWRWGDWTAYTGLITLGASILALSVSIRLQKGQILTYLAFTGITASIYEYIFYQASLQTGGNPSNLYLILSLVTVAIAIVYRCLVLWSQRQSRDSLFSISLPRLTSIAHGHWIVAFAWKICTISDGRPLPLLLVASLAISVYAILQARNQDAGEWIYLGGIDFYLTFFLARWFWQNLSQYDPFYGALSCLLAYGCYYAPWPRWRWPENPWRNLGVILPILTAFLTFIPISYFSLWLIAVFYARIALTSGKIRWSYVSLLFINGGLIRFFDRYDLTDILIYATPMGFSILYIAWVDPVLQSRRTLKHYWRVAGSGVICVTALLFHQDMGGLIPSAISLLTVFIGLGLRIRAFLFVGTIVFLLSVSYQLIVLSFDYSLLKWMIGLIVGIVIISIAAIFERLKEQMIALWRNIWEQLRQWE